LRSRDRCGDGFASRRDEQPRIAALLNIEINLAVRRRTSELPGANPHLQEMQRGPVYERLYSNAVRQSRRGAKEDVRQDLHVGRWMRPKALAGKDTIVVEDTEHARRPLYAKDRGGNRRGARHQPKIFAAVSAISLP
jgi:hypothetical protein